MNNRGRLKVVVTTYNPGKNLDKCLNSIEEQSMADYDLCLVDDASDRNLVELNEIIDQYCERNSWKFIRHDQNTGPLKSRIDAISALNCKDQDVVILIDGDDYLYSSDVFETIFQVYSERDILITVGNFLIQIEDQVYPDTIYQMRSNFFTPEKRKELLENNSYRDQTWMYPPLRTFKYCLYKQIRDQDLRWKNKEYLRGATDRALLYPMLELSEGKFIYLDKILYVYVHDHPDSYHNHPEKKILQMECLDYIKKLPKYHYGKI